MEEQKQTPQIDFNSRQEVLSHVLNLLNELQEHYNDDSIAGLLAMSLMAHLADCEDRQLFEKTHRYLDESLTELFYKINPDGKTLVSPFASRHYH
jgi:hypothetical protein